LPEEFLCQDLHLVPGLFFTQSLVVPDAPESQETQYQSGQHYSQGIVKNNPFSFSFGIGSFYDLNLGHIAAKIKIKPLRIVKAIC